MLLTPMFDSFTEVCHGPSRRRQSAAFKLNKFPRVIALSKLPNLVITLGRR